MTVSTIAMVAGEASGDFLGAQLISALRERGVNARFAGIGGPKMVALGFESWFSMELLAVRGYVEVLRHLPRLLSLRRQLGRRLLRERPLAFVGIDAPDFNLSLENRLRASGIKVLHYVSPSIWAWRGERIRAIARAVDHMLVLFPFESDIYARAGIPSTFVGHPMADLLPAEDCHLAMREQLRIAAGQRVYAMLPGSRLSEVDFHAELFLHTAQRIAAIDPRARFLVPLATRETRERFEKAIYATGANELPLTVLFGHAREAMGSADAVLVASGTATLEAALLRRPMVITYRMSRTTWNMMSRKRYQPWVGLPNIIAGKFLVPELLQEQATPENLSQALCNVAADPAVRERLPEQFAEMHRSLRQNSSRRAAEAVAACLPDRS